MLLVCSGFLCQNICMTKKSMTSSFCRYALAGLIALQLPGFAFAAQVDVAYPLEKVEDGDTLVLNIAGESSRVQLLGIDAPEDTENPKFKSDLDKTGIEADRLMLLGKAATEHMNTLLNVGDDITVQGALRHPDRYGRIPAVLISAEGRNLSDAMVQDGYAIALSTGAEDTEYVRRLGRLERFARKSSNGLWGRYPELSRQWYDRTR